MPLVPTGIAARLDHVLVQGPAAVEAHSTVAVVPTVKFEAISSPLLKNAVIVGSAREFTASIATQHPIQSAFMRLAPHRAASESFG